MKYPQIIQVVDHFSIETLVFHIPFEGNLQLLQLFPLVAAPSIREPIDSRRSPGDAKAAASAPDCRGQSGKVGSFSTEMVNYQMVMWHNCTTKICGTKLSVVSQRSSVQH